MTKNKIYFIKNNLNMKLNSVMVLSGDDLLIKD